MSLISATLSAVAVKQIKGDSHQLSIMACYSCVALMMALATLCGILCRGYRINTHGVDRIMCKGRVR